MAAVVRIDHAAVQRLLTSEAGVVVPEVRRITRQVSNLAKQFAPVDTGQLRSSIGNGSVDVRGPLVVGTVTVGAEHAMYQLLGTGIYGPKHRVITPKNGRYLVFPSRGGAGPLRVGQRRMKAGALVFARQVRGTPKNPFLQNALQAASPWPVTIFDTPVPSL